MSGHLARGQALKALCLLALTLVFQAAAHAVTINASLDGGNQASSGSSAAAFVSPADALVFPTTAGIVQEYVIPADASSITYNYLAGSGRYTWTLEDTVGVAGLGATGNGYGLLQHVTVGTNDTTGWYSGLSECCYQLHGIAGGVIDVGTGLPVGGLSFSDDAVDRSTTYIFDSLAAGTQLKIYTWMNYTMPVPLVTDGDKLFHSTSITQEAAVPVPSAVWLFGSAIGLLGWLKRRNS